jgi:hypothetical protein
MPSRTVPARTDAPTPLEAAGAVADLLDAADRVRAEIPTGESGGLALLIACAGQLLAVVERAQLRDLVAVADRLWWAAL